MSRARKTLESSSRLQRKDSIRADVQAEAIVQAPPNQGPLDREAGVFDLFSPAGRGDAAWVRSVAVQRTGNMEERGDFGGAKAKIVIGRGGERVVDPAARVENLATEKAEVERDELGEQVLGGEGTTRMRRFRDEPGVLVDQHMVRKNKARGGVGDQRIAAFPQGGIHEQVVAIEPADEAAARLRMSILERSDHSSVRGGDHSQSRVIAGKSVREVKRAVRRTVVVEDVLEISERLRAHAPHRRFEEANAVVHGGDDRDLRRHAASV